MPSQTLTLTRDLERAQDRRRQGDASWAAIVLEVLGRACPFPALVYWTPDLERIDVRAAGTLLARMTYDEARRVPTEQAAAVLLGLRARDAYLDLEALPHDHQLGQD